MFRVVEDQLTKRVAVVVGGKGQEKHGKCNESLKKYSGNPLIEIFVIEDPSDAEKASSFRDEDRAGFKIIEIEKESCFLHSIKQALRFSDPESDVLILNRNAELTQNALSALQKAAYNSDSIAISVPQQVLAGGE